MLVNTLDETGDSSNSFLSWYVRFVSLKFLVFSRYKKSIERSNSLVDLVDSSRSFLE